MIDLGFEGTEANIVHYQALVQQRARELTQAVSSLNDWVEHLRELIQIEQNP